MPLVERRYAEAMIRVGLNLNSIDKIQDELNQIIEVVNANVELKRFLNNPGLSSKDKKTVIEKLLKKEASSYTVNFLKLLVDKGRIKSISEIVKQYTVLADQIKKCLNIRVITSADIAKDQLKKIGERYKTQYGSKDVKVDHVIDTSIIGGVIVKIGDKMIDGSIKGKLDGMLNALR